MDSLLIDPILRIFLKTYLTPFWNHYDSLEVSVYFDTS